MDASAQPDHVFQKRTPEQNHRRQSAWQIWVPLGLLLAIFLTVGVLLVLYTSGYAPQPDLPDQQSPLAKSSVIFLVAGACLGSLLQLLILIGLVILSAESRSALVQVLAGGRLRRGGGVPGEQDIRSGHRRAIFPGQTV